MYGVEMASEGAKLEWHSTQQGEKSRNEVAFNRRCIVDCDLLTSQQAIRLSLQIDSGFSLKAPQNALGNVHWTTCLLPGTSLACCSPPTGRCSAPPAACRCCRRRLKGKYQTRWQRDAAPPAAWITTAAPPKALQSCPSMLHLQTEKYPAWDVISKELTAAGVQTVGAEAAFDMSELGKAVLVDVRPQTDHEQVGRPSMCTTGSVRPIGLAGWLTLCTYFTSTSPLGGLEHTCGTLMPSHLYCAAGSPQGLCLRACIPGHRLSLLSWRMG